MNGAIWLISTADRKRCAGLEATSSAEFASESRVCSPADRPARAMISCPSYCVKPSASQSSPDMLASSKVNGSSVFGRIRSTFQA